METLAPIHINLTDKDMVPEATPRGYLAMVYENKLVAVIIVLIVVLLCVLAYMFWKRDGGKPSERQSPYRKPARVGNAQPQPSREELERVQQELDEEEEEEYEEDTAQENAAAATTNQVANNAPVNPPANIPPSNNPPVNPPANNPLVNPPVNPPTNNPPANIPPADNASAEETEEKSEGLLNDMSAGSRDIPSEQTTEAAAGKTKCGFGACKLMATNGREFCWRHAKKSQQ